MIDVFITFILVIFALVFKRSKIICILLFLFMYSLAGWNTWNGDYDAYKNMYESSILLTKKDLNFEEGYTILNSFFRGIDFSFQNYLKVIYFFILSIFAYTSLKYSKYPAFISAVYLIIFIMEYVFIRNYLAHSLLMISLLLILKQVRYSVVWFVILTLIASTIHSTSILWLPFIFAFYPDKKLLNVKKTIAWIALFIIFSAFLFRPLLLTLGGEYSYKLNYYLYDGGLTTVFFVHPIIVGIVYVFFKKLRNRVSIPSNYNLAYNIVVNINLISLYYLGLYYHIPYFARFLRFLFTLDLIFMLSAFYYISFGKTKLNMILLYSSLFIALVVMFLRSTHSLTVYPLYKKNLIWGEQIYDPSLVEDYSEEE